MTPWASGVQDQPERSEASTDKLIEKKYAAPRRPKLFSSAVASGQPEAQLKSIAVREKKQHL